MVVLTLDVGYVGMYEYMYEGSLWEMRLLELSFPWEISCT